MLDSNDDVKKKGAELNAATRRIPIALIEEQIRKEKEKALKKDNLKTQNIPLDALKQEIKKEDINTTIMINSEAVNTFEEKHKESELADKNIDSTQVIALDKTLTMKTEQLDNLTPLTGKSPFNSDLNFSKPQAKTNLTPWIIMLIIIITAAIIFYAIGPENKIDNDSKIIDQSEKIKDETIKEKGIIIDNNEAIETIEEKIEEKILKPAFLKKIDILETINLSNDNLSGESQKIIRKKGALLSEENDPGVVAIVDALIKRLEIIKGVKTSKRGGVLSKRWRGMYRGFKIDAQKKEKNGKIILNKIFLTTPAKGQISIINGVLNSIRKIKYETFIENLGKNGISVLENTQDDEMSISVNLTVLPPKKALSKKQFLLSASGIFGIKGGDSIENIKLYLPEGFRVIKKKIEIDEQISYNIHKVHNKKFHPLFFVKEWQDRVEKVEIISTRFRTKEGIGINSSLGLMRIYFPDLKIAKTRANQVIVIHPEIGGYFIIDSTVEDFTILNFKDSAKIIKIILE